MPMRCSGTSTPTSEPRGWRISTPDTQAFRRAVNQRIRGVTPEERLSACVDYFRASFGKTGVTPAASAWTVVVVRWIIDEHLALGDTASAGTWMRELELLPQRTKVGRNLLASGSLSEAGAYLQDRAADLLPDPSVTEFAKADLAAVLDRYARITGQDVPGAEFLPNWIPPPVALDEPIFEQPREPHVRVRPPQRHAYSSSPWFACIARRASS
jgi:hypothetical protein